VNHKELPDHQLANLPIGDQAPQTDLESRISQIWCQVLNVERVGRDDSFFDLGGHSLSAMQIIMSINQQFDVNLPMVHLLTGAPTIAQLAAAILEYQTVSRSGA
jgi:acyl carrier protein